MQRVVVVVATRGQRARRPPTSLIVVIAKVTSVVAQIALLIAPRGAHATAHPPPPRLAASAVFSVSTTEVSLINDSSTTTTATSSRHEASDTAAADELSALSYLQRYGYMASTSPAERNQIVSADSFSAAVAKFQRFAGIASTGQVDNETVRYMQMPRCGNQDTPEERLLATGQQQQQVSTQAAAASITKRGRLVATAASMQRVKRYALQGSKWRRQELTYRISQYPTRFAAKRHEVDAQIEKAFGIWSQVAPIKFVQKRDGRVHIDIRFASGDHGDGDAFDGPGNTLAHAYFPQYGGDAHFDDQEYWTIDSYAGTNIFQVAAHELGHSLGLGHSNVREALMAPFYQKYKPNFRLHIDDVLAIQALYGELPYEGAATTTTTTTSSSSTTSTTSTTTSTTEAPARPGAFGDASFEGEMPPTNALGPTGRSDDDAPDLCLDPSIDAATRTEDGNSYVFKADYYWLLTPDGLAKGYPRRIQTDWDDLPGSLDAALTWADGKTFFFKGNKYWRYRNKRRDVGYPKLISAGFAGIPDDIDAAFVWSGNGRTYIFKGAEYWRFDSKSEPPVSGEYPRSIKLWSGVPAHVNAALRWQNNVTYFFKGSQYYRFNDKEFRVETRGRPAFPRPSAEWWFGCANSNTLAAQRAPVSHLRGSLRRADAAAQRQQQPTHDAGELDWSILAGLGERIAGTHIVDRDADAKTASSSSSSSSSDVEIAAEGTLDEQLIEEGPSPTEPIVVAHARPALSRAAGSGGGGGGGVSSGAMSTQRCESQRAAIVATLCSVATYAWLARLARNHLPLSAGFL